MLKLDPHDGAVYAFRGRRGDIVKLLWWDGQGLCLYSKRLERGRFVWPPDQRGFGFTHLRPDLDAPGGDRLAHADANLAAGSGLLTGAAK
jgi:transposase